MFCFRLFLNFGLTFRKDAKMPPTSRILAQGMQFCFVLLCVLPLSMAWTANPLALEVDRRAAIALLTTSVSICGGATAAEAYTPDSDRLRESLYLISRAQEATVQQERLVNKGLLQEELRKKMKLSLKLVDRSYRLLDQINYCSQFVEPSAEIVTAAEAGNEAVEALQSAIYFVNNDLNEGPITEEQRTFLTKALQTTREELFVFVKYMPQDKLSEARLRIERENVDNREEFDGDSDAGVYSPVKLPWK